MLKPYKIIFVIAFVITINFLASNFFTLNAQTGISSATKVTVIERGKPATDEEREYSKEFRLLYPDRPYDVYRLMEMGKNAGNQEIGSSIGVPSTPNVEGRQSAQDIIVNLSCKSDLVQVGRVKGQSAHLTDDGRFVYTQYQFVVDEIFKNNVLQPTKAGNIVQFTRPGGLISIDNQRIRIEDRSYPPLVAEETYLLFLKFVPRANGYLNSETTGLLILKAE